MNIKNAAEDVETLIAVFFICYDAEDFIMYYLDTSRLHVEIAEPKDLVLQTTRFDHAGYITEVILDKEIRFCATEPHNMKAPSSGGRGLCSEFRFDVSQEAKEGEFFPKIGVGLIRKPDQKSYIYHRRYQEYQPFEIRFMQKDNEITFVTEPMLCMGYAVQVKRKVTAMENCLIMETQLTNVGEKSISFREYCHNFISLDGMALGPDYVLELPDAVDLGTDILTGKNGLTNYRGIGGGLAVNQYSAGPSILHLDRTQIKEQEVFHWRLSYKNTGISVSETSFFMPARVSIWSYDHMLCPEVFYENSVLKGETCIWVRQWQFNRS